MNLVSALALALPGLAGQRMPARRRVLQVAGGLLLVCAAATLVIPEPAHAQIAGPSKTPVPKTASAPAHRPASAIGGFVFGKVVSIEPADGTIVIDHEDIPNLGMSPMAMEFLVKDRDALARLKPGDAVRFRATRQGGQYVASDLGPR